MNLSKLIGSRRVRGAVAASVVAGAASVVGVFACGTTSDSTLVPTAATPEPNLDTFIERELARNPNLRASLRTTVMLDLEPAGAASSANDEDTGTPGLDVVPYSVSTDDTASFCLGTHQDGIAQVDFTATDGRVLFTLKPGDPAQRCGSAPVAPGEYRLNVLHDASTGEGATKSLFVHTPPPGSEATNGLSQCSPTSQVQAPGDFPDSIWHVTERLNPAPTVVRTTSFGGRIAASSAGPIRYDGNKAFNPANGLQIRAGGTAREIQRANDPNLLLGVDAGLVVMRQVGDTRIPVDTWNIVPAGRPWSFFLLTEPRDGQVSAIHVPIDGTLPATALGNTQAMPLTFSVRQVPAERVGELKVGEAALYTQCNYQGIAYVINESGEFPNVLSLPGLENGPKSVKLGCDTTLRTYADSIPIRYADIVADVACDLPNTFATTRVRRTAPVVIDIGTCASCNFANKDLSGKTLGGTFVAANFNGTNFTRANLSKASFQLSTLNRTIFDGATADGATFLSFTRYDAKGSTWRGTSCVGCRFEGQDLSSADMTGAILDGATIGNSTFDRAVLEGTSFLGATFWSTAFTNTDLRNAKFGGAAGFQLYPGDTLTASPCTEPPKNLRLSTFAGSTFTLAQLPTSIWRKVNLDGARILGTTPTGDTSLDNADLCGLRASRAHFIGFTFRGAKFDSSVLIGAEFVNLDLRDASFAKAIASGAVFIYSDMKNVDFSGVVADAYVDDASLGSDAGGGQFLAANFKGTTFAPRSLVNTRLTHANFRTATVSFPAPALRAGLEISDAVFAEADLSGSNLVGFVARGGNFSAVSFLGVDLTDADFQSSATQGSDFTNATFCGAAFDNTRFDGTRSLSGALFPTSTIQILDKGTKAGTFCTAIRTGAKAINEAIITRNVPICPNDRPPPSSAGCLAADFVVDQSVAERRLVCPGPNEAGVAPTRLRACRACTSDCDCSSLGCTNGVCSFCGDGGR